jgi:glycine cleavage system transcriptional repressor
MPNIESQGHPGETTTHELVLTAVGPDRPGIAAELSGEIHAAGANLADTRMVNLRGKFALVALVQGSSAVLSDVRERLAAAAPRIGLSVDIATPSSLEPASSKREGVLFRLKTYSMDQPGIVHAFTTALREKRINIEELETRLESAPFMGSPVFTMEIVMLVPSKVSVKALRQSVEALGDTLNCDVDLDPV